MEGGVEEDGIIAWDDVSGAALDPKGVRKAREEEIQYVKKMNLYTKVPTTECYARTGKAPISTRADLLDSSWVYSSALP